MAEDTSAQDTSTNDDAPAESEAPAAPAEPTEAKPQDPEASDQPDEPAEAPAEGEQQEEGAEEDTPDPKEVARRSYAERQRMKAQTQQAVAEQLQPPTVEELEQQGYTAEDARYEALRQRVEASETASTVADLTANMNMDAATIEQELDIFRENNPDGTKNPNFDKDFAEKVSREYMRDAQVQFDPSGQFVTSARIPMYDYYKSRYEDRMAGMKHGQVSGQKAAERMLAASETPSSAAPPPQADKDPITKGFEEVFGT